MRGSRNWQGRLADWLAGDTAVLSLPEAGVRDALPARLAEIGYAPVRVDFTAIADKDDLMAAMARALGLDSWFGANWDALGDALFGPEAPSERAQVLVFDVPPSGPALDEADFQMLLQIVCDVAGSGRSVLKGAIVVGGSPFRGGAGEA